MTQSETEAKAAAGWHRDRRWPGELRRWDGQRWLDEWRPAAPAFSQRPEGIMVTGVCLGLLLGILAGVCFSVDESLGWVALWAASSIAGIVFMIGAVGKAVEVGIRAARR